ncbi:MAG: hypothetical protein HKN92_04185 [Chitinophagales bacterium]|nr:hypothetical protein [Chitinophagales bacterium]
MFHLVFNGHLGMMAKDDLPPSFQFAVLEQIKDHLLMNRFEISYHEQDMLAFINSFNPDQCGRSFYSLSDLLSFDDFPYMVDLLRSIEKKTNEAKIVFRSFIRNVPGDKEISSLNEEFNNFTDNSDIENTTMYSVYSIDVDE